MALFNSDTFRTKVEEAYEILKVQEEAIKVSETVAQVQGTAGDSSATMAEQYSRHYTLQSIAQLPAKQIIELACKQVMPFVVSKLKSRAASDIPPDCTKMVSSEDQRVADEFIDSLVGEPRASHLAPSHIR